MTFITNERRNCCKVFIGAVALAAVRLGNMQVRVEAGKLLRRARSLRNVTMALTKVVVVEKRGGLVIF